MSSLSIHKTIAAEILLKDDTICKAIFQSKDSFEAVITQLQRDVVNEGNAADIGHTILAIKMISDAILVYAARGATLSQK